MKKICLFVLGSALVAVTCLVLPPVRAIASDETDQSTELQTEPLEKYDNPPAPLPLRGTGVSPGMISEHDQFTSHQVNVNAGGLNITGDAANEPSIAVDPTNGNKKVIGWRQFDSVTSNFRQSGYGYTSNGGSTWTFPGVLENNVFRSDPVLVADDIGRFFYNSLLETFFDNIWRSLDSGQTWTNLQGAGNATGGDKQWHAIDNTNSTGHGFQYQIWSTSGNNFQGRQFSRSIDGGVTWMDPINIPNSPIWGTPDVDTNGILFIGGVSGSQIRCIRSSNAKNGAVTPTFDQNTAVSLGGTITSSQTINPGGLTGQLFLVVDRSGTATNNNIYMLASVRPTGASGGADVRFARSTNGGVSFSASTRINDDAVNPSKWHWMGTLAVAPNGRIDSVWLDTRNAANNTDSQLFYSYSTDGGVTWAPNVSVSNSFNPFLGYPNQNKMGDYMTIVSDNTGGDVAYAATFNLEEDIYYARVSPSGGGTPTPTPTPGTTATPTPTPASTPTPTPGTTPTPTPVVTPTPTPGTTPTPTPVVTPTPTPGTTPTPTPVVTPTPTPGTTPTATPGGTSTPTPTPGATLTPTPTPGGTATPTPTPGGTATPAPSPAAQALNLSTRMQVQTGANVGIGGFIITGSVPMHVLLRAIGPSLAPDVPDALADTVLELHGPGAFITITNDNWRDDPVQEAAIIATGIPPANNLESAIDVTLNPGTYTAIISGKNNTSGVGLVEVYDLSQAVPAKLANISTRAFVGTDANVVIAGFILGNHTGNDRIAVRGLGPSLTGQGVPNALANPNLELHNSSGTVLASNNNWQDDAASAAQLTAAGLALSDPLESGTVTTLSPGLYTAVLSGVNSGTGVGLVEVYDLGAAP